MDFDKCQDRFAQLFGPNFFNSNYLDIKLKVFEKDDKKELQLVQNHTMKVADFSQFMQLRTQFVNATDKFVREENMSPVVIPTLSKDMDGQFKLAHKGVDVVNWANRKVCVTLLRYIVDKPESSFVQFQFFGRKGRTASFNKLSKWSRKLKKLSIYLK